MEDAEVSMTSSRTTQSRTMERDSKRSPLMNPALLVGAGLVIIIALAKSVYTEDAPAHPQILKSSLIDHQTNYKGEIMMLFDGYQTEKALSEEKKIARKIWTLYEGRDSRIKIGELFSVMVSKSSPTWSSLTNFLFVEDEINNVEISTEHHLDVAVKTLLQGSRNDAEKSLFIMTNNSRYEAFKKANSTQFKELGIRTSWILCDERNFIDCRMIAPDSDQIGSIDLKKLAPNSDEEQFDTEVYTHLVERYPTRYDKPLHLRMQVFFEWDLTQDFYIYVPETSYNKKIFETVKFFPHKKKYSIDFILEPKNDVTFLDIPEFFPFEIRYKGKTVNIHTNAFSFRSDMLAKSIIDWSPQNVREKMKTELTWIQSVASFLSNYFFPEDKESINVCFFGEIGSGKSSTQNTLMSALRNDHYVETMRPVGGGGFDGSHVTTRIQNIELRQRYKIPMRFWDTFGLSWDNWPEQKFKQFLHGHLTKYSISDHISETKLLSHSSSAQPQNTTEPGVPSSGDNEVQKAPIENTNAVQNDLPVLRLDSKDRIHSVLLFMTAHIFKNAEMFKRMIQASKIASSEGYNPLLMITFTNDYTAIERDILRDMFASSFSVPKHQVVFVPFHSDSPIRDFKTDFESLHILNAIIQNAESFLEQNFDADAELANKDFEVKVLFCLLFAVLSVLVIGITLYKRNWLQSKLKFKSHIKRV